MYRDHNQSTIHQRDARTQLFSSVSSYNPTSSGSNSLAGSRIGTPSISSSSYAQPSSSSTTSNFTNRYPSQQQQQQSQYPQSSPSPYRNDSMLDSLESQNDKHIEGLSAKVKMLKDITVKIGDEVRDSNNLLTNLENNFEGARTRLKGTYSRMVVMADRSGISLKMWLIFFGIVFIFFFYVWLK